MKHYWIDIPSATYAYDEYADSEEEARRQYRERYGYRRLPAGTLVYPAPTMPTAKADLLSAYS